MERPTAADYHWSKERIEESTSGCLRTKKVDTLTD